MIFVSRLKSHVMKEKKLILYISMSLDGYLATKDDDISWLSIVERKGEDEIRRRKIDS